jgi:hypothetical protein
MSAQPQLEVEPSGGRGPELATASPTAARRQSARQRPLVVDVLAGLAGLGLGITIALGITAESAGSLSAAGGIATAIAA